MSERACSFTMFLATALASALVSACGSDSGTASGDADVAALELSFEARSGQARFACGSPLEGVGEPGLTAEPLDLRLYVHDVRLLREGGEEEPFVLLPDGQWQSDRVALLDFEDGSGRCDRGTDATNTVLRGKAPQHSDFIGFSFTLGVPPDLNHLNLSTAMPPLDEPGMWWSWQGGYKYLRAELATDQNGDGYLFHLGATGCEGSPAKGYVCAQQNLPLITLLGDIRAPVSLDVAALFAGVNVDQKPDLTSDLVPGCMSSASDPECGALFATLGLPEGEQEVLSLP